MFQKIDKENSNQRKAEGRIPFPAAFLFGCSSAKLRDRGFHEPIGALTSLFEKNSPLVVGNLWDVTDKDLDRFSIQMLENYYGANKNPPLDKIMAESRRVCKLGYAVGAAPVIFGIPLPCV